MEQGWNLCELFGDKGVKEVEGLAETERAAEIERQRQPSNNINQLRTLLDRVPVLCSCAWSRTCSVEV